jgi:predicted AlkP superfamily phosphohydrolase/phosphomutase
MWRAQAVAHVMRNYQPDLMLASQGMIANCRKAFLLVDARQPGYDGATAEALAALVANAHSVSDRALGEVVSTVDLSTTAVLVVSVDVVALNAALRELGLLETSPNGLQVVSEATAAYALTSGAAAHIYLNVEGREGAGIVGSEQYEVVQESIVSALGALLDTGGQPVLDRIRRAQELSSLHLESPNAGDLFVQAQPGYCLSEDLSSESVLGPARVLASGGHNTASPGTHGILVAAGPGLRMGIRLSTVHILDIAPTLAELLHFLPAPSFRGRVLSELLE